MADLSVSGGRQENAASARALDDLKQDQDQKLRDTRADWKRKISDAQEAGEAAVNHIKRVTDERVDQTRSDGTARIKNEVDSQHKTYTDLKRRANQQTEQMQMKVENARSEAGEHISEARSEEARALEKNQRSMREFMESQNELKREARAGTNNEIEDVQKRGADRMHAERSKNDNQLASYRKETKESLDRLREHDTETYTDAKKRDDQRLSHLRESDAKNEQSEQSEMGHRLNELSHRYQEATKDEHARGEQALHTVQKDEEKKLANVRSHGARVNEQQIAEYSLESKRIQQEGESELAYEHEKYDDLKKAQGQAFKTKMKQLDQNQEQDQVKTHREQRARAAAEAQTYQQALKRQRSEFNKNFESAARANNDSLATQKQAYLGTLYKEKMKFDSDYDLVRARMGDDFYRMKTFSPHLEDRPDSYVLRAHVEPHEKDNVEIIVRDNHITLSAKRAYQNDVKDGETRTSTNSYQTFRQEFKLDYPIDVARTYRNVDENGEITVFAPKKGSGDGLVWSDSALQRSEQGLGRTS